MSQYWFRRQAIACTNADPGHLRIYAALGGDELIHYIRHIPTEYRSVSWGITIALYIVCQCPNYACLGTELQMKSCTHFIEHICSIDFASKYIDVPVFMFICCIDVTQVNAYHCQLIIYAYSLL